MQKLTKKQKRWIGVILIALLLALAATFSLGSYYTNIHTVSGDSFYTIGNIKIRISGQSEDFKSDFLTPLQEYTLSRHIINIGDNDAYVFMTVTVPITGTKMLNTLDGNYVDSLKYTQVLSYGLKYRQGHRDCFKLITSGTANEQPISPLFSAVITGCSEQFGAVDENGKTITYTFAYVDEEGNLLSLAPGEETEDIFDIMKLSNFAETYNMRQNGIIDLKAYGIQTNQIGSETDCETVWQVLYDAYMEDQ